MHDHKPQKERVTLVKEFSDKEMLDRLLCETFPYFLTQTNSVNGLIADKNQPGSPSSIAVVGFGLCTYISGVERGLLSKAEAIRKILATLRFFYQGEQGTAGDAMGHKGFFYHFLDMETGKRAWKSELSSVDTAFFIAGALTAAQYFKGDDSEEQEIRNLADLLYRRVDWCWMQNGTSTLCHGWKPRSGFLRFHWDTGYSEALLLYILAMGSPTFPISQKGYRDWISTFEWVKIFETHYLHAAPLFIHQFSHLWLDFRGIRDDFNREKDFDYFENSRKATHIQRQYAIENKAGFPHYNKYCWGFTASDGPGPAIRKIDGQKKIFYDYVARGVPHGPDDGTVSPWAVVASLPFAPEIVVETIRHAIGRQEGKKTQPFSFDASFNPIFPSKNGKDNGWISPWKFGLNEGPIILMIENYQTGLIWELAKKCPYIINGLHLAGFRGGWLED